MVMTTRGAVVNPLLRKEDNAVTVAAKNLAYSIGVSQWGALLPLFQRLEDLEKAVVDLQKTPAPVAAIPAQVAANFPELSGATTK